MKKIALCLHGAMSVKEGDFNGGYKNSYVDHDYIEYREDINDFVDFSACYKSIKKHIIDHNTDYKVDVYIHMWYQNKEMKNKIINLYKPKKHNFEENIKYRTEFNNKCMSIGDHSKSFKGNVSRAYSLCQSLKYATATEINYDLVISYRPDVLLWKDMDLKLYSPTAITTNGKGGDFHYIMSKENAIKFSGLYDRLNNAHYRSGCGLYNRFISDLNVTRNSDDVLPNKHQEVLRKLRKYTLPNKSISNETLLEFGLDKSKLMNEYDTGKKR